MWTMKRSKFVIFAILFSLIALSSAFAEPWEKSLLAYDNTQSIFPDWSEDVAYYQQQRARMDSLGISAWRWAKDKPLGMDKLSHFVFYSWEYLFFEEFYGNGYAVGFSGFTAVMNEFCNAVFPWELYPAWYAGDGWSWWDLAWSGLGVGFGYLIRRDGK